MNHILGAAGQLLMLCHSTYPLTHPLPFLQATGLNGATLVDADLCQFGACEDGYLVQLVAQGG